MVASYLRDRSQRTVINGSRSDPSGLTCGVPQGSVLGPLMFMVYTLAWAIPLWLTTWNTICIFPLMGPRVLQASGTWSPALLTSNVG